MTVRKKKAVEAADAIDPFSVYFSVGESIATLLHPYAEVVLHDLGTGRIVRVWNSLTERQAGDPSNLKGAQDLFPENESILGPYEKALPSQGRTKSITAGLRSPEGKLIGFLCTNLDVSLLDSAVAVMSTFISPELKRPEPIYRTDLQQHISYLVRDYSLKINKPIDNLSRQERVELVAIVDRDGLFQARNAVMHVAKAMKVSRASVYNLLADVNKANEQGDVKVSDVGAAAKTSARIAAATRTASAQAAATPKRRATSR
jgi:predicted transcriptional regulator YheO